MAAKPPVFVLLFLLSASWLQAAPFVFEADKTVTLSAPEGSQTWRLSRDDLSLFSEGAVDNQQVSWEAGALPVGWYKIDFLNDQEEVIHWTSLAVLTPLKVKPSDATPVAVDVALSWVPPPGEENWNEIARLCTLAGVTMVRDRIHWRELQPEPGPFVAHTKYDDTAAIQHAHGLDIMQVFHHIPMWVRQSPQDRNHIPKDLRLTWAFCKDAAARFKDTVQVWQPWNEANVVTFGGHTTDEMASHQKAAFLGFKEGNPDVTVSWGPYAGVVSEFHYQGFIQNNIGPYFDVFSMHTYDWNHDYPRLRKWVFESAGGKPVWVSESDRGMLADPESEAGDFTWPFERLKAAYIVQSISSSLATGVARNFHFVLPWYMEQKDTVQFGLLRKDGSPRMGYVALAATGRLLADAKYLGQWKEEGKDNLYAFAFSSRPQGENRDVLVAWAETPTDGWHDRGQSRASLALPEGLPVQEAWDYLGRPLSAEIPEELTGAPVFLLFPEGTLSALNLEKNVLPDPVEFEEPVTTILQFYAPVKDIQEYFANWATHHDRTAWPGQQEWELAAYNFSEESITGKIEMTGIPEGWKFKETLWEVTLEPMERLELVLYVDIAEDAVPTREEPFWLVFRADMDNGEKADLAVSFRSPK